MYNILCNLNTHIVYLYLYSQYSLLHVCPPMGPPDVLKSHSKLTDKSGFLSVDPATLKHVKYSNIYGIGDCLNAPNSKTMAAVGNE